MLDDEYRKIFTKKLKYYMEKSGKTQMDLMNDLGLGSSTVSSWCTGAKMPRMGKIQLLADYFNINKSDLIEDAQSMLPDAIPYTPGKPVQVVGAIQAGYNGYAYTDPDGYALADVGNPEEYVYLKVRGNSMEPEIHDGSLALIHKQPEVESGEIAAVLIDDEGSTLKKVIYQDGAIILQAFNPEYPPTVVAGERLEQFRIFGKLVETKRKW